ncbi:DoxX family protein [Verrucomicrobiales bacterium]|nr:DoxX family protein [Verrucomicrobiales bacterium]
MRKNRIFDLFAVIIRFALGGIFLYSGIAKIGKFNEFAASIAQYELFTTYQIELLAHAIPLFEANLGLWLIIGFRLRAPSLGVTLLTSVFLIMAAQAQLRGLDIQCHCFGKLSELRPWQLLVRNSLLCLASFALLFSTWRMPHPSKTN